MTGSIYKEEELEDIILDTEGEVYSLKTDYRTEPIDIREDVTNAIEAEETNIIISCNIDKEAETTSITIIGGRDKLTKEDLITCKKSKKRYNGHVGKMGDARFACLVHGVKEKTYEQSGYMYIIVNQTGKRLQFVGPKPTSYNSNRVKVKYTYPKIIGIKDVKKLLTLTFAPLLYENTHKIKFNGEYLKWIDVFPNYPPTLIKHKYDVYGFEYELTVWVVNQKIFTPKYRYPKAFRGLRMSLNNIMVHYDDIGSTEKMGELFGFINSNKNQFITDNINHSKNMVNLEGKVSKIITDANKIIKNTKPWKIEERDISESMKNLLKYALPKMDRGLVEKTKCPNCSSQSLKSMNDRWKCRDCDFIFDKKWTKPKSELSGKGINKKERVLELEFVEVSKENQPFLIYGIGKNHVWGVNMKDSNTEYPKIEELVRKFGKFPTVENAAPLLHMVLRCYLSEKILNQKTFKTLEEEWLETDKNFEVSLNKKVNLELTK